MKDIEAEVQYWRQEFPNEGDVLRQFVFTVIAHFLEAMDEDFVRSLYSTSSGVTEERISNWVDDTYGVMVEPS